MATAVHNDPIRKLQPIDVDRVIDVVLAIRAIPTLSTGVVGFGARLEGGHWYWDQGEAWHGDELVIVEIPDAALGQDAVREALMKGLEEARQACEEAATDSAAFPEDYESHSRRAQELQLEAVA